MQTVDDSVSELHEPLPLPSGVPAGLRSLYEAHGSRLHAVLLRILRAEADAEEVLQEVFLTAWLKARTYDPARASIGGWLLSIARSRAIDRVRKDRSRVALEDLSFDPEAPPGVFDQVALHQARRRLLDALRELTEVQREAVLLAYFEGLSLPEIAARSRAPLGTVKTRVRLALGKLARSLGEP